MKVVSSIPVLVLLSLFSIKIVEADSPYTVPQPTIEVFRPRGLRVSIPDEDGIRLFAFHGVVNRNLNGLEAGDLSKDILKKHNGRWVFEDRRLKLNLGDALHFWLFVIKDNLGFRLDDQSHIVTGYIEAPPGFITGPKNPKNPNRKPSHSEVHPEDYPSSINSQHPPPPSIAQAHCVCPQRPIELLPPTCITENNPQTTQQPPLSTTPYILPDNVNVLRELLVNYSRENVHLRSQLVEIQEDKTYLVNKLENIRDVNLHKLILSGNGSNTDSAMMQVETVLREKLKIDNFDIVKSAIFTSTGSISFELKTLEDKLHVLRKAKTELKNSKFNIVDAETSIFMPR